MFLKPLSYSAGLIGEILESVYTEKLGEDLLDVSFAVPGEALCPLVPEVRYKIELRASEDRLHRPVEAFRSAVGIQGFPVTVDFLVEIALLFSLHGIDGDYRFVPRAAHEGDEDLTGV
ncbi:MAG: hypothetical protein A4E63_00112 [Syntrophorhabdus sp. PtaU1.Bin050]|nr:MAG: hypothetical protein A4E63_00112 [Syntrophorhabdus sp. PtaU1.Bin050]